ncbi:MAG TPA: hypothetical protein DIC18_00865, partial [Clostridiales bacterium]|nr:hypothetical protein [Clostridiales bacterium]
NDPDNPLTYTAEQNVVLEIPVCYELNGAGKQTGGTYNFLGWHDADGNEIKVISADWKKPITLYAYWDFSAATYFSTYQKGKYTYVDIGRYPQHIVENQRTVNELKTAIANGELLPDEHGLYTYKGILYSKTTAHPYQRSTYFSDGSEVKGDVEYFFIVEPITWRVLSGNPNDPNSEVLLLSEDVLTASAFREKKNVIAKNGLIVYPNNWQYSDLRAFLNGDFYSTAFMDGERAFILNTTVDYAKTSHFDRFANGKPCDDYIFLLSYADTANRNFGWAHWTIKDDSRKVGKATDYAKAMGVYASLNRGGEYDASHYWLTSSGEFEGRAGVATALGNVGTYDVDCKSIGVRPMMKVKLS